MTNLAPEQAPTFWGQLSEQGFTPDDIGSIHDLGKRLVDFVRSQEGVSVVAIDTHPQSQLQPENSDAA